MVGKGAAVRKGRSPLRNFGRLFPVPAPFDYIPMYDKFREVSSLLVSDEFTIPL